MSWAVLISCVCTAVTLVVAYMVLRKQPGVLSVANPSATANSSTAANPPAASQTSQQMPCLPPTIPRDGVVILPVTSYHKLQSGQAKNLKIPADPDSIECDKYRVYMERHYTVKVPIVVDIQNPTIWTSHQATQDETVVTNPPHNASPSPAQP